MFISKEWVVWGLPIRVCVPSQSVALDEPTRLSQIGFTGCKGFATLFDLVSTPAMCYYLGKGRNSVHGGYALTSFLRQLLVSTGFSST